VDDLAAAHDLDTLEWRIAQHAGLDLVPPAERAAADDAAHRLAIHLELHDDARARRAIAAPVPQRVPDRLAG